MNPKRVSLMNAARKALFQRAKVQRSAEDARANFAPTALKQRATNQITRRVDLAVDSAERGLRRFAIPLGIAAVAGLAFAFRRPLADAAHAVGEGLSEAVATVSDHLASLRDTPPPASPEEKDDSHEPV